MSVYVGPLFDTKPNKRWPYKRACHLTADSVNELMKFAQNLGLKKSWYQPNVNVALCHFKVTWSKRAEAIRLGAQEITQSQVAARIEAGRITQ